MQSIDNKPASDKSANTPEFKKEVLDRILQVWIAFPNESLFDVFQNASAYEGLPKPLSDRDLLHRIESYYSKSFKFY